MAKMQVKPIASAAAALLLSVVGSALAQANPGVVYPGGAAPGAPAAAQPAQPGQPGAPVAGAPSLPPLPGAPAAPAQVRPGAVAVDDVMPAGLSDDVRELKRRMDEFQRAQNNAASQVAKPVTRTITVSQAAGEEPPVVRLAPGVPTNVVFIDSTGQPWPIDYATPGDANRFDVLMPIPGTSSLQIRPRHNYGYGGLSVSLKGNHIPISLSLAVGQTEVDSRLDVKIARRGPNAAAPIIDRTGLPHVTDVSLMSFLDGVPPQGATEVKTSSKSVRAWRWAGKLVVRTDSPVVSPAWSDSTMSPSGVTNAYILPDVPTILVSSEGRMVTVKIDQ